MSGRKSTRILSFNGMPCPMAIGQLAQVLPTLGIGDTVEVRTDDPGAVADFPAWAKTSGNELLQIKQRKGEIRIILRRRV